ncbi:MAG: amidohydrolase family protein, partial [Endomicrobia bacterium]|nr:amidohydrolase family protein [Endomicrobiia bacterium]
MIYDIIIKNAKIYDYDKEKYLKVHIGITDGKINKITTQSIKGQSKTVIDAKDNLVTPTFIDPHIHLDKCLISEDIPQNKSGTLKEAIMLTWERKRKYTKKDILFRAGRVIEWAIQNGTTYMRTHVDVDPIGKLVPVEGMLEVKEKYKNVFDLQIVAFPQEGILQSEGTEKLLEEAIKLGADVVGGMPHNERIPEDSKKHIDICFEIATKYNKDIDMHVDETDDPNSQTLQYLAYKTIKENYKGKVTAAHTCALAAYNDYYAQKVIDLVAEAQINMITNPATNLMLEGRLDKQPIRRGITRVKELIQNGVNVAYGQDCVKDAFYPYWGKADMLEVGLIVAHAAQFTLPDEVLYLYKMLTVNSAKILNIKNYGLKVGDVASLNVINASDITEMFRLQPERLYVIKNGKVVATWSRNKK